MDVARRLSVGSFRGAGGIVSNSIHGPWDFLGGDPGGLPCYRGPAGRTTPESAFRGRGDCPHERLLRNRPDLQLLTARICSLGAPVVTGQRKDVVIGMAACDGLTASMSLVPGRHRRCWP
jgi:hypothetical protein